MTIIVGVVDAKTGEVHIAADTMASDGWNGQLRVDKKVFVAHGIGYGFTSSYRMGQILQYHSEEVVDELRQTDTFGYVVKCLVPMWRRILTEHGFTKVEMGRESFGTFVVGIDGHVFTIDNDFQVGERVDGFAAVGCGCEYAMGSLFSSGAIGLSLAQEAVEAAKYYSTGCGGDTVWITVGGKQ